MGDAIGEVIEDVIYEVLLVPESGDITDMMRGEKDAATSNVFCNFI